ncbi:phosphate uptake regulator PhoU [Candidatus Woesearchaeota archaeon]|nr:phosphate uptake regulator PhoU [Candidatus Woesearchaeota archaeon]
MKRKLVKQGLRALTVTIPSSWIDKNNLHAGDEVDLIEVDDSLTLSTEKKQPTKEIIVDVGGLLPRMADRFMARSYQKGYDKITVKFDDPELMLAVKNKVPELMGFEILNIGKNEIEVQVISQQLDLDFDVILRRAFLILMDMAKTCHDAWKSNEKKSLENIFHQDFDVNRFLYFCLRYLNKSQKVMNFGRSILYYLIESLEDLGDELKELGRQLAGIKPDRDVLNILDKLNEMFRNSYEFFYAPDKSKAVRAFKLSKEISALIDGALAVKNKDLTKALMSIELSTRIVYHLTTMRLDTLKELSGDK